MSRLLACLLGLLLLGAVFAPRAEAFPPGLRAEAEAALACQVAAGFDSADCLRAFMASPELRAAATCLLRGEGGAGCLGIEAGILGGCLLAGGFSPEATAGCLALRYAAAEAARCLEGGIGSPEGCFPPDHPIRRGARALTAPDAPLPRWWGAVKAWRPGW